MDLIVVPISIAHPLLLYYFEQIVDELGTLGQDKPNNFTNSLLLDVKNLCPSISMLQVLLCIMQGS